MAKSITGEHPLLLPHLPRRKRSHGAWRQVKSALTQLAVQPLSLPFTMEATAAHPGEHPKVNTTRVLEALIIAALTSLVVYITSIPKLETKIDSLSNTVTEVKSEIKQIRQDFYIPSTKQPHLQVPSGNQYYVPKDEINNGGK